MPININGYNLSNASGLTFGASSTKIDSSGITDPFLPAVFGSRTDVAAGVIRTYPWVMDSTTTNVNSCWNGSVFTCPVTGVYYMSWSSIVGSGAGTYGLHGFIGLIKNGGLLYYSYRDTNNIWELQHLEVTIKCAAGDTITWAINIAPAPDSTTGAGAYGANHNASTIWLVG